MKLIFIIAFTLLVAVAEAQELYIYTEPASNVPTKSISAKLGTYFVDRQNRSMAQRYMASVYLGLSKKWMMRASATFADMHTSGFRYESFALYGKYRFFSEDEEHKHFRMAVFGNGAISRAPFLYEEISLMGDKTGAEAGLVATQLIHRLALSSTVSHTQALHRSRFERAAADNRPYQSLNYSLSAGYLLLPKKYESYKQTNLNLYTEFMAQQTLDKKRYYIDMAPGIQFIFNSNSKLNLGYRLQLGGDMSRMTRSSFLLSFERIFFGAL